MLDPRVSDPTVLYDADCGFCKVVLAALLLVRLRAEILSRERTASWIREAVAS